MIEDRTHIRLLYNSPAVLSLGVEVSGTPAVQSDGSDRSEVPTILKPVLYGDDEDAHVSYGWTVDGTPVSIAWGDGFGIAQDGTLTLSRNFGNGEYHTLLCTCFYTYGASAVQLTGEEILIGCAPFADGAYSASCSHSNILYDELEDALLRKDYKESNGISADDTEEYTASDKDYLIKVKVLLVQGDKSFATLPEDLTMRIYRDSVVAEAGSFASAWLLKAEYPDVWLDARLMDTATVWVKFFKADAMIAQTPINFMRRRMGKLTALPAGGRDVSTETGRYTDEATVSTPRGRMDFSELHCHIRWSAQDDTTVGYGDSVQTTAVKMGIESDTDIALIHVDATERGAMKPATDEKGIYFTDEKGNKLIL